MIKETSTCAYLMIIYTPRLCADIAFLPPQENAAHPITCKPVLSAGEIDAWSNAQLAHKAAHENGDEREKIKGDLPVGDLADKQHNPFAHYDKSAKRPIIGGIPVGAQSLVGSSPETTIEKSVVVGGGKETFLVTVASSTGETMSVSEMKKWNIGEREVELFKRNLKKLAGRKAWKLDLVDTPRGREFRGIIEAEDQVEDESGEEGKGGKRKGGGVGKGKGTDKGSESGDAEEEEEARAAVYYKDEL
jgi:protein OS-9